MVLSTTRKVRTKISDAIVEDDIILPIVEESNTAEDVDLMVEVANLMVEEVEVIMVEDTTMSTTVVEAMIEEDETITTAEDIRVITVEDTSHAGTTRVMIPNLPLHAIILAILMLPMVLLQSPRCSHVSAPAHNLV
jgi:hypothetical protein